MDSLDGLSLIDLHQDLYRNIVSLRRSEDLFDDLSHDPEDWQAAVQLDLACKPAQFRSSQPIIDRPFEDALFKDAVQFPFDHWSASRFSQGHYGVWYGSECLDTTVYETVYHWRLGFLADVGWENRQGVSVERRVHLVQCQGALINLLPKTNDWPALRSNDYAACQRLGARIHREGHPGLWTPSARCEGVNAAIFTPHVLCQPRVACYLEYRIEQQQVVVRRNGDVVYLVIS